MPERPSVADRLAVLTFWIVVGLAGAATVIVGGWDGAVGGILPGDGGWGSVMLWLTVALAAGWSPWRSYR